MALNVGCQNVVLKIKRNNNMIFVFLKKRKIIGLGCRKASSSLCVFSNNTNKSKISGKEENLEKVFQQCQFALEQLASGCDADDEPEDLDDVLVETSSAELCLVLLLIQYSLGRVPCFLFCFDVPENKQRGFLLQFYDLLKSRVDCPDFLKKL